MIDYYVSIVKGHSRDGIQLYYCIGEVLVIFSSVDTLLISLLSFLIGSKCGLMGTSGLATSAVVNSP